MPSNPYAAHIEASVLTAEPVELVRTLYRGALDAVSDGRACAAAGDIAGRSAAVSKAVNILRELALSLNPASEPAMARNLLELYDYMQRVCLPRMWSGQSAARRSRGLAGHARGSLDQVDVPPAQESSLMQHAG